MTAREWKAGDRALIEVEIDEVDDGTVWVLVTGRPKGARRAHVQVATDALLSLPEPSGEDVIERSREVLGAHHPVVGKFAHLNPVVGCQCMDRVFIAGQENYPSHIRDVLAAAGLLANPDAIRRAKAEALTLDEFYRLPGGSIVAKAWPHQGENAEPEIWQRAHSSVHWVEISDWGSSVAGYMLSQPALPGPR